MDNTTQSGPAASPGRGAAQPDYAAIKARQQAAWATGDFAVVGVTLQIVGETLGIQRRVLFGGQVAETFTTRRGIVFFLAELASEPIREHAARQLEAADPCANETVQRAHEQVDRADEGCRKAQPPLRAVPSVPNRAGTRAQTRRSRCRGPVPCARS